MAVLKNSVDAKDQLTKKLTNI